MCGILFRLLLRCESKEVIFTGGKKRLRLLRRFDNLELPQIHLLGMPCQLHSPTDVVAVVMREEMINTRAAEIQGGESQQIFAVNNDVGDANSTGGFNCL